MTKLTQLVKVVTVVGLLQQATTELMPSEELSLSGLDWLKNAPEESKAPHSRQKRFFGLPIGSQLEVKWAVNWPFDTYLDSTSLIQLGLPIKVPFPQAIIVGEGYSGRSLGGSNFNAEEEKEEWSIQSRRAARQERISIFGYLEAAIEKAGLDGRECLLRTICDVAEAPFHQGLLGKMINTLLTTSAAGRPDHPSEGQEYDRYLEAELHGKMNGKCEFRYSKCKMSPFELFPNITHNVFEYDE